MSYPQLPTRQTSINRLKVEPRISCPQLPLRRISVDASKLEIIMGGDDADDTTESETSQLSISKVKLFNFKNFLTRTNDFNV